MQVLPEKLQELILDFEDMLSVDARGTALQQLCMFLDWSGMPNGLVHVFKEGLRKVCLFYCL